MPIDRYPPVDLFALIPKLATDFAPGLRGLDRLLDDDLLVRRIRADLAQRHPHTLTHGRHSTPVEVVLRLLVVKHLYHWSDDRTEHFVADSLVLRQFCRVYLEPVPDDTALIRWAKLLGSATMAQLNGRVVELARSYKVTRGRKLRVDSTVVETTIRSPTDSRLLGDGVRVLSRLPRRAKDLAEDGAGLGKEVFRSRARSVRRLTRQLHRVARRQGAQAAEGLQGASRQLLGIANASHRQATRVRAALRDRAQSAAQRVVAHFDHFLPLIEQAITQATRRVLRGETVPAPEQRLGLFAPQTPVVKRHKAGKEVECGRKLWLAEVEGGIVSD